MKMNRINSSSLFHFTKRISTLKKILENGIRYSYSVEERPDSQNHNYSKVKVTIPMICFCDIPLMRTSIHRKTYGNYCIGFDKCFLKEKLKETLNPVSYYNSIKAINALRSLYDFSESMINEGLNRFCDDITLAFDINNSFIQGHKVQKDLEYILAYYKPCSQLLNGEFKDYTDEREWRAVLEENKNMGCSWNFNSSGESFYDEEKKEDITIAKKAASMCNEGIKGNPYYFLRLTEDEIGKSLTHIFTKKEAEIPSIADFILKSKYLFGCNNISNDLRKILVSKITSFERIGKDF